MVRSSARAICCVVVLALLLGTGGGVSRAVAQAPAATIEEASPLAGVTLSLSTAQRLVLELTTPSFELDDAWIQGRQHVTVSAPGLDDAAPPGTPRLPSTGVLVGLPPSGDWSVRVVEMDVETLSLPAPLLFAATQPPTVPGAEWEQRIATPFSPAPTPPYDAERWYPSSPVDVGEAAIMRDLRVVPLRLHPFRYHHTLGRLEYIRSLVVEVSFEGGAVAHPPVPDGWDGLLQNAVINYDVARAWRGVHPGLALRPSNAAAALPGSFKVELEDDGLYEIDYATLLAAGFPVDAVDPRDLHLSVAGEEVAVLVEGEDDGTLDPGDRILFYGQAAGGRYTRRNVYWLTHDGTRGSRMAQQTVAPTDTYPVSTAHRTTLHLEENHLYDPAHPEAGGDHWYWADLGFLQVECPTAAQIFTFQLPHRWTGPHSIDLRTSLQGYTPGTHNLAVSINGQPAGSLIWQDQTRLDCVLSF
ncbi:MAG TPA: C25 family peptidase propeptide domain-containing protein, partial [Anaerolineae bacterium]|nr:C25 family peptidase propeptide domain-containing protein [Anaerolineae bacterium]